MALLAVKNLTFTYPNCPKPAIEGVSLTVEKGEMLALLGVNGAGKTTTIRMLSCLSAPTEGECAVCGFNCSREQQQVKARIGLSPQDTAVAENLTVRENLSFMAQVYGLAPTDAAISLASPSLSLKSAMRR